MYKGKLLMALVTLMTLIYSLNRLLCFIQSKGGATSRIEK